MTQFVPALLGAAFAALAAVQAQRARMEWRKAKAERVTAAEARRAVEAAERITIEAALHTTDLFVTCFGHSEAGSRLAAELRRRALQLRDVRRGYAPEDEDTLREVPHA